MPIVVLVSLFSNVLFSILPPSPFGLHKAKYIYVWSRELADSGKKSWGYHIRELVEGLKLHEFHECLPVGNPKL